MKPWLRHNSPCAGEAIPDTELPSSYVPVPSRLMSCFNAAARLCMVFVFVSSLKTLSCANQLAFFPTSLKQYMLFNLKSLMPG